MDGNQPNEQFIRDVVATVEAQARGMWRYRWRALIVSWIICVAGWLAVYTMPDVYEANARIYVDTENAIRPLLQGIAASSDLMNEVTVVTREMLSRPNLAAVARDTDLDLRTKTDADFQSLLDSLRDRINVAGNRDNIFSIAYRDPNRENAIAVVDALVNTFVEKSLGADRSDSSQARSFLRQQISNYEQRLTEAEDRLAEFKRQNVALMPDQQGDYFSRFQTARSNLEATQRQLRLAEERRAELLRQLEGEEPVFGIMTPDTVQSGGGGFTAAKIHELEGQLEELRLRYTDRHPRIGQILDTIELLKKQQAEEQQAADSSGTRSGPGPLDQNPVYQNMRIQLTNTEVEIASLRAKARQETEEVAELRRLVDTVPQVEAELNRLNRDYGVVKSKYEELLRQLESAMIGESADASIDEVQFRIIDPPFAALKPAGPKRQLFLAGVLILGLGAGGALTFLLNLLHPVFFYPRSITSATGIPVLGTVSMTLTAAERRKRRAGRYRFAAALAALVLSFVLVLVFSEQLSPEVRKLASAVS